MFQRSGMLLGKGRLEDWDDEYDLMVQKLFGSTKINFDWFLDVFEDILRIRDEGIPEKLLIKVLQERNDKFRQLMIDIIKGDA